MRAGLPCGLCDSAGARTPCFPHIDPLAKSSSPFRLATDASGRLGRRHLQVALMALGLSLAYSCRINLSVCIVAMTGKNSTNGIPVSRLLQRIRQFLKNLQDSEITTQSQWASLCSYDVSSASWRIARGERFYVGKVPIV